jgi:methylthioribulose-1-phosphate dehydratase
VKADQLAATGAALANEAARFASFGWMRGTSGNLSAVLSRDPLRLAVTASGKDKGDLTPADIVVVDATGRHPPDSTGQYPPARPSAEAALHTRIVRLTGAGAVVHVHTLASVIAGRRWPDGLQLAGLEMLKGIGVPATGEAVTIPVVTNSQDMAELGDRVEATWNSRVPAVVVADHGLYAWGSDLLQARHHTEVVEWLLELAVALA